MPIAGFRSGNRRSRETMRSAGNFHPEWGYLVPMPGFRRSFCVAAIAAAIGAAAGAMVVVSLASPSQSKAYNASIAAQALISRTEANSSSADALSGARAAAPDRVPLALASLSRDAAKPVEIAPAAGAAAMQAAAEAHPVSLVVHTRKSPGRAHRWRVARSPKHPYYERGVAPSFRLPQNSRLVQFEQSCCTWTMPPAQRNIRRW